MLTPITRSQASTPSHDRLPWRPALALLGLAALWQLSATPVAWGQDAQNLPLLQLYKQIDYSEYTKYAQEYAKNPQGFSGPFVPDADWKGFKHESAAGKAHYRFEIPEKILPGGSPVKLSVTVENKPGQRYSGVMGITSELVWKDGATPAVLVLAEHPQGETKTITKELTAFPRHFSGNETILNLGIGHTFALYYSYGVYPQN
jgi:hypothetical protein